MVNVDIFTFFYSRILYLTYYFETYKVGIVTTIEIKSKIQHKIHYKIHIYIIYCLNAMI